MLVEGEYMGYQVKLCETISDLKSFVREANIKGYEIIATTETMRGYNSYYTILFRS
nr:MAG TPA: hypothetical protein [Caudoviricetes sp.]